MKRNFDEHVLNLDGEPIRAGQSAEGLARAITTIWPKLPAEVQQELGALLDKEAGKPLTLGLACRSALISAYPDEPNITEDEQLLRVELARRILKGGVQEIEPKDRDRLKPLIRKRYSQLGPVIPVVVGELLEKEAPATQADG